MDRSHARKRALRVRGVALCLVVLPARERLFPSDPAAWQVRGFLEMAKRSSSSLLSLREPTATQPALACVYWQS